MTEYASRMRKAKIRSEVLAVAGRVEILRRDFDDEGALHLLDSALSALRAVAEVQPASESGVRRHLGEHTQDVMQRVSTNRGYKW